MPTQAELKALYDIQVKQVYATAVDLRRKAAAKLPTMPELKDKIAAYTDGCELVVAQSYDISRFTEELNAIADKTSPQAQWRSAKIAEQTASVMELNSKLPVMLEEINQLIG